MRFETDVLTLDKKCWLWSCKKSPICDDRFYRERKDTITNTACFSRLNEEYDLSNAKKITIVFDTDDIPDTPDTFTPAMMLAGRVTLLKHFSRSGQQFVSKNDPTLILGWTDNLSWWVEIVEEF